VECDVMVDTGLATMQDLGGGTRHT
jgi:hypothetical protein